MQLVVLRTNPFHVLLEGPLLHLKLLVLLSENGIGLFVFLCVCLHNVLQGSDFTVAVVEDVLELQSERIFGRNLPISHLQVLHDIKELVFDLPLVILYTNERDIINLLRNLRLLLEGAKSYNFGLLQGTSLAVRSHSHLQLFNLPIQSHLVILHGHCQIVQLVDLDLKVESETHLVLIFALKGQILLLNILPFDGFDLSLVRGLLKSKLCHSKFLIQFIDLRLQVVLVPIELFFYLVDLIDLVFNEFAADHLEISGLTVLQEHLICFPETAHDSVALTGVHIGQRGLQNAVEAN